MLFVYVSDCLSVYLSDDDYETAYFYRPSICEGGLGSRNSVRPSVRQSVCHTRGLWQN